jgi:cytochrome b subunit of formate dehydrogenase
VSHRLHMNSKMNRFFMETRSSGIPVPASGFGRTSLGAAIVTLGLLGFAGMGRAKAVKIDVVQERPITTDKCFECHDTVKPKEFVNSVHGGNACTSCHVDIVDIEKHSEGKYKPLPVSCMGCHQSEALDYRDSIHRQSLKFTCAKCHTPIHFLSKADRRKVSKKVSIIQKCTTCHKGVDVNNGHAAAVLRGNDDAAVCSDCHGLHNTRRFHTNMNKFPEEARVFYNRTCKKCHGDRAMMRRNNLTTKAVDTYEQTYHGKVQRLGYPTHVAGCADCHTSHNILRKKDPRSTIHPKNLVKNCGRCHKNANANFVKFQPHADYRDRAENPALFWTVFFMTSLLIGTFLFFWLHTALWWRKTYWETHARRAVGEFMEPALHGMENPGQWYTRFKVGYRIMHLTMITAIFSLIFTGMPLKFSGAPWAKTLMGFWGGAHVAGFIHRAAASVLIVLFLGAAVLSVRFLLKKANGATFWDRLFSPDSLFPRLKDWDDFRGMMRWFVDVGPMPKFDRWTYWEKFDFLAVFWGMAAIGLSGLILWMPDVSARIMPGWVFNIAIIVHSDEAMLASGFIVTVHFFNTHFIPTKFPMDTVIFTGRIQKYKLLEEKPLHYERLEKAGLLEQMKAEPPDILTSLVSGTLGMIFITLGVLVVIMLLTGLFNH